MFYLVWAEKAPRRRHRRTPDPRMYKRDKSFDFYLASRAANERPLGQAPGALCQVQCLGLTSTSWPLTCFLTCVTSRISFCDLSLVGRNAMRIHEVKISPGNKISSSYLAADNSPATTREIV